ncbi:MAG: MarR family transcriptional regulator [Bacteroidia bacterium]|nr:MarR family transcriptional regulator [Bacteroidia bacterium]
MKLKKLLKVKAFRNKWEKLLFNFQLANSNVNQHIRDCFRGSEVTYQQYLVLKIVFEADDAVNNSYIKQRILDRDSDVSRLLKRLLDMGLIRKSINASDKRHAEIRLTEKGVATYEEIAARIHTIDEVFFNLSSKEVKALNMLLDKIREN